MKSLKDRLAHLTFRSACKLLGSEGEKLIRRGGHYEIDIDTQITLREGIFRLFTGKSVGRSHRGPMRARHCGFAAAPAPCPANIKGQRYR
jgi:hypothetical protein